MYKIFQDYSTYQTLALRVFDVLAYTVAILGTIFFFFLKAIISPFKLRSSELCKLHLHC